MHYKDPTAEKAVQRVMKKHKLVMDIFKLVAKLAGVKIVNGIQLRDINKR